MTESAKATGRPWKADPDYDNQMVFGIDGVLVADCSISHQKRFATTSRANAELICRAVNTIDTVTAERNALAARVKGLEAVNPVLVTTLNQALGIIVEFGNLNGLRNLSDDELGSLVIQMAKRIASVLADAGHDPSSFCTALSPNALAARVKELEGHLGIVLSALREFEEAVGESIDDEGGDIRQIERALSTKEAERG